MITSHSSGTSEVFRFLLFITFHFYAYKASKCFGTAYFIKFMTIFDNNWLKISIIQYKFLNLGRLREKSQIEKRYCFYLWKTKSGKFSRRVKRQRRSPCRIHSRDARAVSFNYDIGVGFFCYFSFLHRFFQSLYSDD